MRLAAPILNVAVLAALLITNRASAFEGRIRASFTQGNRTQNLLYTVGADQLRIENTDTNRPHCENIVNLQSGAMILVFPHNHSFVRLTASTENNSTPGVPGMPGMSGMPSMPMPGPEKLKLTATSKTANFFGFACRLYELKQRSETLDVWATDQLFPFRPYLPNQPSSFTPRVIEYEWPELLHARKLFPLLMTFRQNSGVEFFRFAVKSITPGKITDPNGKLFQPPAGYQEIQPLWASVIHG
jgi:Domain of unknown function (DUF4412)